MKAKDLLANLSLPLDIARGAAPSLPLARHVRLADGKASATDGGVSVEIESAAGTLGCCAPAERLASILDGIATLAPEAEVKLKMAGKRLEVSAPRVRHSIPTLPAEDLPLPVWPEKSAPITDWKAFVSALGFVERALARKDNRPFCTSVGTTAGALSGTDGHRAHYAPGEAQLADGLLLPLHGLATLASLPDATAYARAENALGVHFKGGRFLMLLAEGTYPDMRRVVPPAHSDNAVTVERVALERAVAAIRKASVAALSLILTVEKNVVVLEDRSDHDGEARIEVEATGAGEGWTFNMNPQFLLDACQSLDGAHLVLSAESSDKPMRVTGKHPTRVAVIMAYRR